MDQRQQEISELFSLWFLKLIIWPYMFDSSFCFSTRLKKNTLDTLFCISDWYPRLTLVSIGFGLRALFFSVQFPISRLPEGSYLSVLLVVRQQTLASFNEKATKLFSCLAVGLRQVCKPILCSPGRWNVSLGRNSEHLDRHVLVRILPGHSFLIFINSSKRFIREKFPLLFMAGYIMKRKAMFK